MSTKIYNGFILPQMSFFELEEFIKRVKKEIYPIARKEYVSRISIAMAHIAAYVKNEQYHPHIFKQDIQGKDYSSLNNIKAIATRRFFDAFEKDEEENVSNLDYCQEADLAFNITFFPMKDKIIGMVFCNNETIKNAFLNLTEVSEYFYWNSCEGPEDISETEWEKRGADWNVVLAESSIPKNSGFIRFILTSFDFWKDNHISIEELQPFWDEKLDKMICEYVAKDIRLTEALKKYEDDNSKVTDVANYLFETRSETFELAKSISFSMKEFVKEYGEQNVENL